MDWAQTGVEETDQLYTSAGTSTAGAGAQLRTPLLDVRGYNSYYASINANVPGAASSFNQVIVNFLWYSDANFTTLVYQDQYAFFAQKSTGTFKTDGGALICQDQMHGPYMQMIVFYVGPDTCSINNTLTGSTRNVGSPYVREVGIASGIGSAAGISGRDVWVVPPDFASVLTVNAGATIAVPAMMLYGRARYRVSAPQAYIIYIMPYSPWTPNLAGAIDTHQAVATELYTAEFIMPKIAPVFQITNTSAVNGQFSLNCIIQDEHF